MWGKRPPEPEDMSVITKDEMHLFITFEQHPKIADLFVSRAFSWYIMDGVQGMAQGKLEMQLIESAGHKNIKQHCTLCNSLPLIHDIQAEQSQAPVINWINQTLCACQWGLKGSCVGKGKTYQLQCLAADVWAASLREVICSDSGLVCSTLVSQHDKIDTGFTVNP